MKNLFKNTLRSFPKNKLSIVTLVFLIFLCLSVFCTMSNTFSNISTQYENIVKNGNLHDFVISELYDVGQPIYEVTNSDWIYLDNIKIVVGDNEVKDYWWLSIDYEPHANVTSINEIPSFYYKKKNEISLPIFWDSDIELPICLNDSTNKIEIKNDNSKKRYCCVNKDFDPFNPKNNLKFPFYVLPNVIIENEKIIGLEYNFKLSDKSTGLFKTIAKKEKSNVTNFKIFIDKNEAINKKNDEINKFFDYIDEFFASSNNKDIFMWKDCANDNEKCTKICHNNITHHLSEQILNKLQEQKKNFVDNFNPLKQELKQYRNKLIFKDFSSFTIDEAYSSIKVINSNPSDEIDKIVLFNDQSGNKGFDLFGCDDYAPNGADFNFFDLKGKKYEPKKVVGHFIVPQNINELFKIKLIDLNDLDKDDDEEKFLFAQIIQKRFNWICNGKFVVNDAIKEEKEQNEKIKKINDYVSHLGKLAPKDYKKYYELFFQQEDQQKNNKQLSQIYKDYFNEIYCDEFINFDSVFLTIEWNFLPTDTIKNYAAKDKNTLILKSEIHNLFDLFTVLNPEYMKQNNKEVIPISMFINFKPFVEWYKLNYQNEDINVNKKIIIDWLNWITYDEYQYWLKGGRHRKKFKLPSNIKNKNKLNEIICEDWKGIEKKYLCNCSNFDFIIIGCGITPDFIYPSINLTKLISNPKKDCLIYLNNGGFKQLQLAHINAPTENFVVCKFRTNTSLKEKEEITKKIHDWSKENMIFPNGTNNVFFNNDKNNQLNANTFRISYLPNIIKLFKIISYIICTFIFLLAIIICIIIIKYYIDTNKVNIGILLANGIKKNKIIFSLLPFVWTPSIIGGIGAYLFGLFMQVVGLKLFKNYWFLPTKLISFNYITMLLCIFFPFIIFSLTSFFSTLKILNSKLTFLLNKQSDFKGSLFSRIAKIPFAHFGIMTRFRIASAFASFWRLLILSITISITMSGTVFSIATFGKIDESNKTNSSQFSYNYAIELVTPTTAGGNYNTFNFNNDKQKGFFQTNSANYIFNTTINHENDPNYYPELTKPYYSNNLNEQYKKNQIENGIKEEISKYLNEKINDSKAGFYDYFWSYSYPKKYCELIGEKNNCTTAIGSLLLTNIGDDDGQKYDLFYTQGRSFSKLALEHDFGIPSICCANPWKLAISMMPLNYQNLANESLKNLIQSVGEKIYNPKNQHKESKWYKEWELTEDAKKQKLQYEQKLQSQHKGQNDFKISPNAYQYFIVKKDDQYELSTENKRFTLVKIDLGSEKNSELYINPYFIELLKTIYSDPELASNEFMINYGSIPLNLNNKNNDDETYTYIEGSIDNLKQSSNKIKILGIQPSSKHVKIVDHNNKDLLKKLYDYKQGKNDVYPIIINSYVAFKNNLKVGDKFSFNPENCVDRFLPQQKKAKNNCKFEIIAIATSTANELFFTTQYFANKILGLPDEKSWNKTHKYMLWTNNNNDTKKNWQEKSMVVDLASEGDYLDIYSFIQNEGKFKKIDDNKKEEFKNKHKNNIPMGFNGIFTRTNINDSYLKFLSLYSPSGLYPSTSFFVSENTNKNKFAEILTDKTGHNLALASFITGLNNEKTIAAIKDIKNGNNMDKNIINDFCNQLVNVYGKTTTITAIKTADDLTTMQTIFNGLVYLFNLIQSIIIAVFFPIAILIVMIISSLLIKQNQKYAIMLKSLGYSDLQNTKNILSLYVPVSIIGIFLSIPLSLLLATSYQMIILKSIKILIYNSPKIFHYLIGCGLIFTILTTCALYGYHSLKKVKLNKEIKS